MSIPINQLPSDLVWNGQLDVSNGVKQDKYNQLNAAWEQQNGGGGSSTTSGGYQPISAPDLNKLETQSFDLLKPYYLQLAKEAQGDFTRATSLLEEDYSSGVRQAVEDYQLKSRNANQDLTSSLASLGITFGNENEQKVDDLNKRGMAVYEQDPNGANNVVDPNNPQSFNLGRGGMELGRLAQDQGLRKQAVQRTADRQIEEAGITKNRYTNTGGVDTSGMSASDASTALAAPGVDRSQLGSSELSLIRGKENATRSYQQTTEGLANQYTQAGLGLAGSVAGLQQKEIPEALKNQYNLTSLNQFKNVGT